MRIENIHINNFLSFGAFSWRQVDQHLNLIVGPNGAGKTNVFHALRALLDDVRLQDAGRSDVAHRGNRSLDTTIILDIELTGEWEHRLVTAFFAAAFASQRVLQEAVRTPVNGGALNPSALARFSQQVARDVRAKDLSWFFRGRLTATYDGLRWSCSYASQPEAPGFRVGLNSTGYDSILYGNKSDDIWRGGSLIEVWLNRLDAEQDENSSGDTGAQPSTPRPVKEGVINQLLGKGNGEEPPPFALGSLPSWLSSTHGVSLTVERPTLIALAAHQALEAAAGIALEENRYYDARWLFQRILDHSLIFTDNLRQPPHYTYTLPELQTDELDISDGINMPLYLFQLKNSATSEKSSQYMKVRRLFQTLTSRDFDIGLSTSYGAESIGMRDAQPLHLSIRTTSAMSGDFQFSVPLQYSGAGVAEALFLSAIIEGSSDRVILLDEPASNLYPLVQTALFQELQRRPENQSLIITHAPALIAPEALAQVSRLYERDGQTTRAALNISTMNREEGEKLRKELRRSLDMRALLFARAVILVEGETELGALPVWFEKLDFSLSTHDLALYNVNGDQNFAVPVRYLHGLAVPWLIICDGKVIGDAQPPRIVRQLKSAGIKDLPTRLQKTFALLRTSLERIGVFTVANGVTTEDESFESLAVIKSHLEQAQKVVGSSKARIGRYIAEEYDAPDEVRRLLEQIRTYLKV